MILLRWIVLFVSLISSVVAVNEPKISKTTFDHGSTRIVYFDDSPTLLNLNENRLWKSDDNGASWTDITKQFNNAKISTIHSDIHHKDRVFVFTESKIQYFTSDKGKTWKSFNLDIKSDSNPKIFVTENFSDRKNVLINLVDCSNIFACKPNYYYTSDEFASSPKKLENKDLDTLVFCTFTSNKATKDTDHNDNHILCITNFYDGKGRIKATNVLSSTDYFKSFERLTSDGLGDALVYDVDVVQSFIVIKAFSDRYSDQSYINLFVSKDGLNFKKAHFPGDLKSESFIILPSNEHSLYVSVWGLKKKISEHLSTVISDLFVSDSDGVTFRKMDHLSEGSDFGGFHSVEKISELDGVWIGNIISTQAGYNFFPEVKSMITFDDGRSWQYLKYEVDANSKTKTYCENADNCHLNLLNAIEMTGDGNFESGPTPGILLGVGSVASTQVMEFDKLSTWVSRDGGYTWSVALDEPCVFSMGDQGNIIVAVPYFTRSNLGKNTDRSVYHYSVDQGKTWETGHFDEKVLPSLLTTTIDGSSQKFVFSGFTMGDSSNDLEIIQNKFHIFAMDFSNFFGGKTCGSGDMEEYIARKSDDSSDAICIMGHKEKFQRRKQDAKCFVNQLYKDVEPTDKPCVCSKNDYECQSGFNYENGECVPDLKYFRYICNEDPNLETKLEILTKIPGNTCEEKNSKFNYKDDKYYYNLKCKDVLEDSSSTDIKITQNGFPGGIQQYVYLTQSPEFVRDETILVLTTGKRLYISHNGGGDFFWASVDDLEVIALMENQFNGDHIVLLTPTNAIYVSTDRAQSFRRVDVPSTVNQFGFVPIFFHPSNTEKLIYIGETPACSKNRNSPECKSTAYYTENGGEKWVVMLGNARACDFSGARFHTDDNFVLCEQLNPDKSVKILTSFKNFQDSNEIVTAFEKTVGIAPDDDFIVVAEIIGDNEYLKSLTTMDGVTWAHAKFPHDFEVGLEQAYTIIKSNSKSVYLHVTTNNVRDAEYGSILKSNSNGTSYVISEDYVNRDAIGFVDFEKIEGIEGVAIINVVHNHNEVAEKHEAKKLKTKITHNDAAEWDYLTPPAVDSEGKAYQCIKDGQSLAKCSLNLHGFTERIDYRDTYSSGSATGMLIGIGNVGEYLGDVKDASTFLTRDAGITWKEIHKKPMSWEFGDQGSILLLIDQNNPTSKFLYSLNEGESWSSYKFSDIDVEIKDVVTIPSDTSTRLILFTKPMSNNGEQYTSSFGIDFNNVFTRQCELDLDNLDSLSVDFEYWTPKHPFLADDCLFGHEARYLRRKHDHSDCFIGAAPLNEGYKVLRNCSCTRKDFECDYNFARSNDGTCKLIKGLTPKDPKEVCVNENVIEYFEPTGYRKIPLSTCVGGMQFDHYEPKPCPGKEPQYNNRHGSGLSGFNLFMVIFVPLGVFIFAAWFVYDKGIKRNGGFSRLGAIRLEENEGFGFPDRVEDNSTDMVVNKVVDFGVMSFMALSSLVNFSKKLVKGRVSLRNSNRYSSLNDEHRVFLDDDDELFGSEEDEDDNDNFNAQDAQFDDDAASLRSDILNDGS